MTRQEAEKKRDFALSQLKKTIQRAARLETARRRWTLKAGRYNRLAGKLAAEEAQKETIATYEKFDVRLVAVEATGRKFR